MTYDKRDSTAKAAKVIAINFSQFLGSTAGSDSTTKSIGPPGTSTKNLREYA